MKEQILVVKCVICNSKKEIIATNEAPVCDNCFGPMIVEKVIIKEKKK